MSISAMKQALEALERGRSQIIGALVQQDQDEAITALRQAIAEIEQISIEEYNEWVAFFKVSEENQKRGRAKS